MAKRIVTTIMERGNNDPNTQTGKAKTEIADPLA